QTVDLWSLNFTSKISTSQFGVDTNLTGPALGFPGLIPAPPPLVNGPPVNNASPLAGSAANTYPFQPAVAPNNGIGPGLTLAADNPLGPFSPYQARLYMAYTGRSASNVRVTTDTDVYLAYSDNAGVTWTTTTTDPFGVTIPIRLNDDTITDGFS